MAHDECTSCCCCSCTLGNEDPKTFNTLKFVIRAEALACQSDLIGGLDDYSI